MWSKKSLARFLQVKMTTYPGKHLRVIKTVFSYTLNLLRLFCKTRREYIHCHVKTNAITFYTHIHSSPDPLPFTGTFGGSVCGAWCRGNGGRAVSLTVSTSHNTGLHACVSAFQSNCKYCLEWLSVSPCSPFYSISHQTKPKDNKIVLIFSSFVLAEIDKL